VIQMGRKSQGSGDDSDPLVSTGAVAEILGVSRRKVARILDAGDMPCERQGKGHRRVRISDVLRYKQESDR
jgi:excisionase family DNA binding protein